MTRPRARRRRGSGPRPAPLKLRCVPAIRRGWALDRQPDLTSAVRPADGIYTCGPRPDGTKAERPTGVSAFSRAAAPCPSGRAAVTVGGEYCFSRDKNTRDINITSCRRLAITRGPRRLICFFFSFFLRFVLTAANRTEFS